MRAKTEILVVSPIRNEEQRIGELIDSLMKQTFKNWHLLVYDNNSDDKSREIVKEKMLVDNRIFIESNNKLVDAASNMNRAIEFARDHFNFDYVLVLGGDDELNEETFLSESINAFENNASMVVPQYELFKLEGETESIEKRIFPEEFNFSRNGFINRLNHSIHTEYGNMFYAMYRAKDFYRIFDDSRSKLIGISSARKGTNFNSDWWFTNTTLRLLKQQPTFVGHITYRKYMKGISYYDQYYFPELLDNEKSQNYIKIFSKARVIFTNVFLIPTGMVFGTPRRFKYRNMGEIAFLWLVMIFTGIFRGIHRYR